MFPVDIHTHRLPVIPGRAILNCTPGCFSPETGGWYSVGIHPWHLNECPWEDIAYRKTFETTLCHPQVLAVGEAGLDKLIDVALSRQIEVFRYQARQAEQWKKPLIIHLVKATDELLALRKTLKPAMPWIIHGFRGKAELAQVYVRQGFYISFGMKYQAEALRQVPADRLFLETDESEQPIDELYEQAARWRGVSLCTLREAVTRNVGIVFFSR